VRARSGGGGDGAPILWSWGGRGSPVGENGRGVMTLGSGRLDEQWLGWNG
jgi:hypothetical protein